MGKEHIDRKDFLLCKTDEDIKMVFDPYRKKIIMKYLHSKEPLTVKQVADKLEEVPAKVHYHVKKLIDYGVLSLAKTEEINGIMAKYYKSNYKGILFEGSELSSEVYLSQMPFIRDVFTKITEKFRKDLEKHAELVSKDEDQRHISAEIHHLYMTKEEEQEFLDTMDKIIEKFSKPDESKEVYSCLRSLARIK